MRVFLVLVFHATAETVNAIMAIPTETRAALLNSGIFGVGEADAVEVAEREEVGLELEESGTIESPVVVDT